MRTSLRLLPVTLVLSALVGVMPAGAAVIDRDIGFDANDIPPNGHIDPDIRSTTRKLAERGGRRMLSIVVRFYESNGGWPLCDPARCAWWLGRGPHRQHVR